MKKTIKRMFVTLLVMVLSLTMICAEPIVSGDDVQKVQSFTLKINQELTKETFKENPKGYLTKGKIEDLNIVLVNESEINIKGDLNVYLTGSVESFGTESSVGVYEGMLDDDIPVLAKVTYADDEAFMILSLGYLGDEMFDIAMFGEYTDSLKTTDTLDALRKDVLTQKTNVSNSVVSKNDTSVSRAIDGSLGYRGGNTKTLGNLPVLVLSTYHAAAFNNTGSTPVYLKVNTNSANIDSYLLNTVYASQNYRALDPRPCELTMAIIGSDTGFSVGNSEWDPKNNVTNVTLDIPYVYGGSLSTFELSTVTSSTTVTASKVNGASFNNKVQWVVKKTLGWPSDEFDGNQYTQGGFATYLRMNYNGNVTSNITKQITSQASVKFYVTAEVNGNLSTMYYTINGNTYVTNVTIVPIG